jgi:pimeloyl-ACP methyl ester carboxylesterase
MFVALGSDAGNRPRGGNPYAYRLVFIAVALSVVLASWPNIAGAASPRGGKPSPITAPTTTSYTVDGRSVSMACKGTGAVPVVFLAGGDDAGTRWDDLVAALGPDVLTCVFDRPGVGASEPSLTPSTPRQIAKTLAAVLKQVHLGRRVVLVGHSIGGLNALVFGATHPKKVAGAVLLDPSQSKFFRAAGAEPILESYGYDPAAIYDEIDAVKKWPSVPLIILSRDTEKAVTDGQSTAELEDVWDAGSKRYAHLSSKGRLVVVPGATHYVDVDAPEAALDAINEVLARVK